MKQLRLFVTRIPAAGILHTDEIDLTHAVEIKLHMEGGEVFRIKPVGDDAISISLDGQMIARPTGSNRLVLTEERTR